MKLVMVHGRAQQGKDPVALEQQWRDALGDGLQRGNATLPAETSFAFPFYADRLMELVRQSQVPLGAHAVQRGSEADDGEEFRRAMLADIAAGAGVSDADIRDELPADALARGPQNWELVQAMLRALDRIPLVNAAAIDTFTRDVYVYLTFPAVRDEVDQIVAATIPDEPCVVLAHSLGTVVAYNALAKRAAQPQCLRFVTVGSPLAIVAIKDWLDKPIHSPVCVKSWFNAYDNRDVVALRALDAANFGVEPPIENKGDVNNFTDNRHGIAGYLADPVVAQRIAEAINSG
jgi:hypothetical protein